MQRKASLEKFLGNRFAYALLTIASLASCATEKDSPTYWYDEHNDRKALDMAKDELGTKYDILGRMLIVQANLSSYIDTHDPVYAQELEKYYDGYDSIDKELSRDVATYNGKLKLAKYYDASILLFVKNNSDAARKLLDSYCPPANFSNYEAKMDCHIGNIYGYDQASSGRYELETAYLINLTIGTAYRDQYLIGNAMGYKAKYDLENAERQIGQYLKRNAWNDEVMKRYCDPVYGRGSSPYVEDHEKYAAASQRANCSLYVELQKQEETAKESANK